MKVDPINNFFFLSTVFLALTFHGSYKIDITFDENFFERKPKSAQVPTMCFEVRKVEKTFFQRDLLENLPNLCFWHRRTLVKNLIFFEFR